MIIAAPFANTVAGGILLPVITAGVIAMLGGLWRTLVKLDRNGDRLTSVEKEIKTNGGGSLKDAVIRIDGRTRNLEDSLERHMLDADRNLDRLNRHMDEHHDKGT